jgi:DNA polymerase-1
VLREVPGAADIDLRNPAQVRALLYNVGIDLPDTRAWRLEAFRGAHPVIERLLSWRKAERIATTYGYSWLDEHVGTDGRLRGDWSGSDGAAGRMTATAGLHNMPADLRAAVAAEPGQVFVRADLGQIEPRVLAAVSGDPALARATADDDLYAPVAHRLGVERSVA